MNQDINYWIARCAILEQELDMMKEQSIVKWQTGEPKEEGAYLLTIDGVSKSFITIGWYCYSTGWLNYTNRLGTAWCKLSDIEPYKEE